MCHRRQLWLPHSLWPGLQQAIPAGEGGGGEGGRGHVSCTVDLQSSATETFSFCWRTYLGMSLLAYILGYEFAGVYVGIICLVR